MCLYCASVFICFPSYIVNKIVINKIIKFSSDVDFASTPNVCFCLLQQTHYEKYAMLCNDYWKYDEKETQQNKKEKLVKKE